MNMMNGWFEHPTLMENLSPDSAIRQFCAAARVEEDEREQGQEQEWVMTIPFISPHDELDLWSSSLDFMGDVTPQLAPSEAEEQLVDTFFNVEYYENEAFHDHHQDTPMMMMIDHVNEHEHEHDHDAYYEPEPTIGVDGGLQLVHLLLACAEAVGCRDARLADSILTQIWPCVSPWGDSLQRVSQCFAMGLKSRLSLLQHVNPNGSFASRANANYIDASASIITREEKNEAFALLHKTTPYIEFGFMAANDAICKAATGKGSKESIHIIDLGMEHTLQWPSLLKMLSSRRITQTSPKSIRFTGIIGEEDENIELESSMKKLCGEGAALGISIEYTLVKEQVSPSTLSSEKLDLRDGDILFVNSIMQLHKHVKESRGSLKTILQAIKKLKPSLVTMVEQDANHNGPFFLGRFLESLHYYSAIFDSLDATLPRSSRERMKIEKVHLAEEIHNVVAYEGSDRVERHERADQWRRQLGRGGFQVVGMKCLNEVKMLVGDYGCDGYTVGCEKGCLQLGWKGRPIMLASAWQLNNLPTSGKL